MGNDAEKMQRPNIKWDFSQISFERCPVDGNIKAIKGDKSDTKSFSKGDLKEMKDQATKDKFVDLRAQGWSFDKIAGELKVAKQTLINWSKELFVDIANLRAIEIEALQEKFQMLKRQRIELLGTQLEKIKTELAKRDLSELPTERLFDLFMRYSRALDGEAIDLVLRGQGDESVDEIFKLDGMTTWKP